MNTLIILSIIVFIICLFVSEWHFNKRTPFQCLYRMYEFFFDRWTCSVIDEGTERIITYIKIQARLYPNEEKYWENKKWVVYKKVNKFDNSVKYEKKYLN